jgi:hypothetical protein
MSKEWAYKLKAREEAGDKICIPAQKAWREVLAKLGAYSDPVKHNNPTTVKEKKIKRYTLSR